MRSGARRNVLKVVSIALSVAIIALLIAYANPSKFVSLVSASDYSLLLMAFLISSANIAVRILKWKVLLKGVKFSTLAPIQLLGITISNFSPGKIGEPVKAVLLKARTGMPVSISLASIIWERVLDVVVLMSLALASVLFFVHLSESLYIVAAACFVVFTCLAAFCILFLYKKTIRNSVFLILKKFPITNRLSDSFLQSFERNTTPKRSILYSLLLSIVAWTVEGAIFHFTLLAIGVDVPFITLACVFALATLIGVATALPGGLGSTDAMMVLLLGVLGVNTSIAVTGVLLGRFASIWYVNILGAVSLIHFTRQKLDINSLLS